MSACTFESNPSLPQFAGVYPSLNPRLFSNAAEVAAALIDNTCSVRSTIAATRVRDRRVRSACVIDVCDRSQVAILPRVDYDRLKRNPEFCKLRLVQTLFPATAGWVVRGCSLPHEHRMSV